MSVHPNRVQAWFKRGKWEHLRQYLRTPEGKNLVKTQVYFMWRFRGTVTVWHLAVWYGAPVDIIKTVVRFGHPGYRNYNFTPLHLCVLSTPMASPEVVRIILDRSPRNTSLQTASRYETPIHIACRRHASTSIIRMLRDANPAAARKRDSEGRRAHSWLESSLMRDYVKYGERERRIQTPHNTETPARASLPAAPVAEITRRPDNNTATPQHVAQADSPNSSTVSASVAQTDASTPNEHDTGEQNDMCVVCWDRQANMALIPCGHVCLCSRCSDQATDALHHKCPVCRREFSQALKVYQAGLPRQVRRNRPKIGPDLNGFFAAFFLLAAHLCAFAYLISILSKV